MELSGGRAAPLRTMGLELVRLTQKTGRRCCWIGGTAQWWYPPDAAAAGVDLAALPLVRCERPAGRLRAAELLLRGGGFALLVIEPGGGGGLPARVQARLARAAGRQGTAVLFLTEKEREAESLGALVPLRLHAERFPDGAGGWVCRATAVRDKRNGPGRVWTLKRSSPPGCESAR